MARVHSPGRMTWGVLAVTAFLAAPVAAQEAAVTAGAVRANPVGAWRVKVAPEIAGNPVFVNLAVFHLDGTTVGFPPASPMSDGTFGSGSAGVWRRATSTQFEVTFYSTMYNGDVFIGYQRVRARVQFSSDGNSFHGRFTNDILDPEDNLVVSIGGTVAATGIVQD